MSLFGAQIDWQHVNPSWTKNYEESIPPRQKTKHKILWKKYTAGNQCFWLRASSDLLKLTQFIVLLEHYYLSGFRDEFSSSRNTYHSTVLWYSDPAEPPTAYSKPSITATPNCGYKTNEISFYFNTSRTSGITRGCCCHGTK